MPLFRSLIPAVGAGVLVGAVAGLGASCCCCGVGVAALFDRQGHLWKGAVLLWPFGAGCGAVSGGAVAAVTAFGGRRHWRMLAVFVGVVIGAALAVPIA